MTAQNSPRNDPPRGGSPTQSQIGRNLAQFEIKEKLGAGGMGEVYLAHDTKLGRDVALKVLLGHGKDGAPGPDFLLNEARAASRLNHPNVCTIYEVGEIEGQAYIAMEYVRGKPLSSSIPAEAGLPVDALIGIGEQVAEAVAHAHQQGIIHRDLKTANIMITPEGRAKVLDFGLAVRLPQKELATLTLSKELTSDNRSLAGTLPYLAPEILGGEPATERSDIWALGVVLYEMAAGALPFEGRTPFEVTSAILREPAKPLPPQVPASLRTIISRCLAKEPGQRYRHAGEVASAIEAIGSDARGRPAIPKHQKRTTRWLLPAGLVMAAIALAIGLFILKGRSPAPPSAGRGLRLSTGELASPSKEANDYYERAMTIMTTRNEPDLGRRMLERALALDSHFGAARAELAFTYLLQIDSGASNDTQVLYKAEAELLRALKDDPGSGRVHSVLAAIYLSQGRKELVPPEVDRAIKANPSDLDALTWLANYHILNGEFGSARSLSEKMLETNPSFFPARMNLGDILRQEGRIPAAIEELEKVLEQDPKNIYALIYLWRAHLENGNPAKARATLDRVPPVDRRNFMARLAWAVQYAAEGLRSEALQEMDEEVKNFLAISPSNTSLAVSFYALLGETEEALEWLDRAARVGDERWEWFGRDPLLVNIRNHPRFKQIMESIAYKQRQRQQPK